MRIKARYSHLNGEEYLRVHRRKLWREVQDVIKEGRCFRLQDKGVEGKDYAWQDAVFSYRHE